MMITLPLLNLAAVAASTESPQADRSTTQAVNVDSPVSAGVSGLNTPPRFELGEPHYPKNVV